MVGSFTLLYWADEDWYVGVLKEMPWVFSQGETLKALKENIRDAFTITLGEENLVLPPGEVRSTVVEIST